jgi:Transposase
MRKAILKEKSPTKVEEWRERIADQERGSLSVKEFCKEHGLAECSFYSWRKRLRDTEPVRFALVERAAQRDGVGGGDLELVLASGERLRIRSGVDGGTLRTVLEALRA